VVFEKEGALNVETDDRRENKVQEPADEARTPGKQNPSLTSACVIKSTYIF